MKSTTAQFVINGFAAVVFGLAGAVLAAVLQERGVLPTDHHGWTRLFAGSNWTLLFGALAWYLALIFWPSQRRVFLDIICIDQANSTAKGEALLSIGAILKSSSRMLRYIAGLWRRPLPRTVEVYVLPLSMLLPFFLALTHVARAFCRQIDDLQQALSTFSTGQTRCGCCDAGHLDENDRPIACDREVLLRCIELWYGDLDSFEEHVRGNVRTALLEQLTSPFFLYWHVVGAASPVMWFYLGHSFWPLMYTQSGLFEVVLPIVLHGLTMWLAVIPAVVLLSAMLAYRLRRKRSNFAFDIAFSLMVVLFAGFIALASLAGSFAIQFTGFGRTPEMALNFACNLCVALACCFLFSKARRCALAI